MTTARPTNSVSPPRTSPAATIKPHSATAAGHSRDSFSEAPIAGTSPTSRSSISGKEMIEIESAAAAKQKPTEPPRMSRRKPRPLVSASRKKGNAAAGGSGP